MKYYILMGIFTFALIEASPLSNWNTPIKDEKNIQPYVGKDYWSNNILNDYGLDSALKNRFLNERLRQHYKMRNGKNFPFMQSSKALLTQNSNPMGNVENDISSFIYKDQKINYDNNAEVLDDDIDNGIWSNAKWLN